MVKWIAALIGYYIFRFPGAIAGFLLGSFIDNQYSNGSNTGQDVLKDLTRQKVSPADFELNLLCLCSIVMKLIFLYSICKSVYDNNIITIDCTVIDNHNLTNFIIFIIASQVLPCKLLFHQLLLRFAC